MIKFSPNQPPNLTVYAPPAWNNPNATQVDFMQYSIPNKGVLPVGTIMQFPTGAQPSDWSLVTTDAATTDSQFAIPQSFTTVVGSLPSSEFSAYGVISALWTGTHFVVASSRNYIAVSTDGVTWVLRALPTSSYNANNLAFNPNTNTLLVFFKLGETVRIYRSSDLGVSWVFVVDITGASGGYAAVIAKDNSFFIFMAGASPSLVFTLYELTNSFSLITKKTFSLLANERIFEYQPVALVAKNNSIFCSGVIYNTSISPSSYFNVKFKYNTTLDSVEQYEKEQVGSVGEGFYNPTTGYNDNALLNSHFGFLQNGSPCFTHRHGKCFTNYTNNTSGYFQAVLYYNQPPHTILRDVNISGIASHKNIPIFVSSGEANLLNTNTLFFIRGAKNKPKAYAPSNVVAANVSYQYCLASNNEKILFFRKPMLNYGNHEYVIATPSANYVTSVPHEPDDGYSWYIKTFI